jgi:hypothetical protein
MARWEYRTFSIGYDRKRDKDWVLEISDGDTLVGLAVILETYGSDGWELVSLQPVRFVVEAGFGRYHMDPVEYRATFKRSAR